MQDVPRDDGPTPDRGDILERIVRTKQREIEALHARKRELRARASDAPSPRDFSSALAGSDEVSLVAEVKRRSPGAGAIRPELDPVEQATRYEEGGAGALSVLTDETYFAGSLADLSAVRERVSLPVLRKDFILDELQVLEARAGGADAVLLIVRILDDARLRALRELAEEAGMAALVEVHDRPELDRALGSGARIVGINNRDLTTFGTDLRVTLELTDHVPDDVVLVSESGISTRVQVERLAERGVDAILVGEALLRAEDPSAAARSLSGVRAAAAPGPDRPLASDGRDG